MKQIEITTRVNNTLEEIDNILTNQEFKIIRTSRIEDKYLKNKDIKVNKSNILDVLKKCVLIRYLCVNKSDVFKKITYKNKVYQNDVVISEEKININIDDINEARKLFEAINFELLTEVNYDAIVYSNGEIELCFQNVENLGILLEYENVNDFEGKSNEEILNEKNNMLNELRMLKLNITDEFDVKKACELIMNKINE